MMAKLKKRWTLILAVGVVIGLAGALGAWWTMFRVDPGFQAQNQENIKQNEQLDQDLGLDDIFIS